jgi:hypothetical protein
MPHLLGFFICFSAPNCLIRVFIPSMMASICCPGHLQRPCRLEPPDTTWIMGEFRQTGQFIINAELPWQI